MPQIDQTQLFQEMSSAIQQVAREFEAVLTRHKRSGILDRHEMGIISIGVVIEGIPLHGTRSVGQIAAYLGVSADRLYKLLAFAACYNRADLECWSDRAMTNGGKPALPTFEQFALSRQTTASGIIRPTNA